MRAKLQLLAAEEISAVFDQALSILRDVGLVVENEAGLALLLEAGVRVDEGRVFLTEEQVRRALASVPNEVRLFGRGDEGDGLRLGGDEISFDPGSSALHFLDPVSQRRRPPTVADCEHLGWVTEACQHIAAQSTALVPSDVPAELSDSLRLYMALKSCTKPVVTGTFVKSAFAVMHRLLVVIRGGEQALRERPLAIFDCAPTPPLKWSDLTTQALLDCARAGIPVVMVSMPMAGATAPVTLRDAVAQHCAETLSGLVLHQLAAPGAPAIYGGSPAAVDMRYGTPPMGAMETMLIDVANAEVGKYLGLPTHAYMCLSDAKVVDWQAGMETAAGGMLAALAGVNMISGPGMLDYESCQSLEKLVLDNEVCGMALRLARGIGQGAEDPLALFAALAERGQLLGHRHTRKTFREEVLLPGKVIERASYDDWEGRGALDAAAAAATVVEDIVSVGNAQPLDADVAEALTDVMRSEARRLNVALDRT